MRPGEKKINENISPFCEIRKMEVRIQFCAIFRLNGFGILGFEIEFLGFEFEFIGLIGIEFLGSGSDFRRKSSFLQPP